jgi:ubiquitin-conjugating enzyme E2 G1
MSVIGIDLGTTTSCVSVFQNGKVEIIANDQGNRITPSWISFSETGERLVGESAKSQSVSNQKNTFYDVKRLIGRNFSDPIVQKEIKNMPFNVLAGPNDTVFEGAILRWELKFPMNYPIKAPEFKFLTPISHPNVYSDGKMCISILHEGKDEFEYEHISERWNPSHSVNSILMSILTILPTPNFDSPANVDASIMWRNNWDEYKKIIYKLI